MSEGATIAIVGVGLIGGSLGLALKRSGSASHVVGVSRPETIDRALASTDVHIVSICAEPERRSRIAVRCAQAGKHLYLDKPMAISHVEAEQIVAAVEQNGVISHMFSQIHTAFASQVKSVLDSSLIGDLREIHCDLLFAKGHTGTALLGKPRLESVNPKEFEIIDSKRELFNIGIYPLALVRWLTGLDVVRVYARTANFFFQEYQKQDKSYT